MSIFTTDARNGPARAVNEPAAKASKKAGMISHLLFRPLKERSSISVELTTWPPDASRVCSSEAPSLKLIGLPSAIAEGSDWLLPAARKPKATLPGIKRHRFTAPFFIDTIPLEHQLQCELEDARIGC